MSPWKAAHVGDSFDEIDTPALVLDLDAFERNLQRLQDALAGTGVRLRPHAKSHKCPDIALRQIKHGAVGICCQKVSEAAAFVAAGVQDVLITNQVVGTKKVSHTLDLDLFQSHLCTNKDSDFLNLRYIQYLVGHKYLTKSSLLGNMHHYLVQSSTIFLMNQQRLNLKK